MSKTDAMIEKVKALVNAPSCCAEAKEAGNNWLEAVNTEKRDEAADFFQHIAAEKVGGCLVENAVFLECLKSIVVQHVCPQITVIACGITAYDVIEIGGAVAGSYFGD